MHRHLSPRRTNSFKPQVEALEDRWTPAVSAGLAGGVLTITGDNSANNIVIEQNDSEDTLKVKLVAGPYAAYLLDPKTKSSAVQQINVDLKEGQDVFTYGLVSGTNMTRSKELNLQLGGQDDAAYFNFFAPGKWLMADLNINVSGSDGNDAVYANFGAMFGGALGFAADMGSGHDRVEVTVRGGLYNGAGALFSLAGGTGNDTFVTDWNYGLTSGAVDYNAAVSFDLRGEAGLDQIYTYFTGRVLGDLSLVTWGGSEDDTLSTIVDFVGAASAGDATIKTYGEAGNDTLTQKVYNASWLSSLINTLNGGSGTDSATVTSNVTVWFVEHL